MSGSPENFTVKEIVIETNRKLDSLLETVSGMQVVVHTVGDNVDTLHDHEGRLRSLERFKNAVPSVAVLSLVCSAIGIIIATH